MSYKIQDAALRVKGVSPTQKFVLVALASFADDDGLAWPSVSGLAELTGYSERAVRNALSELKRLGLVADEQVSRGGRSRTNVVRICLHVPVKNPAPRSENPELGAGYSEETLNEVQGIDEQNPAPRSKNPERGSENPAPRSKNPERRSPEPIKNQSITSQEPIMREDVRERTPALPLNEASTRPGVSDEKTSPPSEAQPRPKKPTPRQMLEAVLRPSDAADVLEHRQRLRKPLTVRAAKALAREFGKLPAEQRPEAVEVMLLKGWQGFEAWWFENWKIREGGASNERVGQRQGGAASASGQRPIDEIDRWLRQWLDEGGESEGEAGFDDHREGDGGQGAAQGREGGGSSASGAASRLAVIPGGRRA